MLTLEQKKLVHAWYRDGAKESWVDRQRAREAAQERKAFLVHEIARIRVASLDTVALLDGDHGCDIDSAIESAERTERARLGKLKRDRLESIYAKLGGE